MIKEVSAGPRSELDPSRKRVFAANLTLRFKKEAALAWV